MEVGRRISYEGNNGTIRYIGKVEKSPDDWIGIEWDDPNRGKHNGLNYFTATHPTSASFLKKSNKKVQLGISFIEALAEKYLQTDNADHDVKLKFGAGNFEVETVGWEKIAKKQAQLEKLSEIGLSNMCISSAGSEIQGAKIKGTCLSLLDLDLSRNLFSTWDDLASIMIQLPSLYSLRVSWNRFAPLTAISNFDNLVDGFGNLKTLILNHTEICWNNIRILGRFCKSIEELHVGFNNLPNLSTSSSASVPVAIQTTECANYILPAEFPHLKILNLESNFISSWTEIEYLAYIPNLTTLILTNNKLDAINPLPTPLIDSEFNKTTPFRSLKTLYLSENNISTWTSLHALNSYRTLCELRFKQNPILESAGLATRTQTRFSVLVARLSNMTLINGTTVSKRERQDAEIYYMSKIGEEMLNLIINEIQNGKGGENLKQRLEVKIEEMKALHPRYEELVKLYDDQFLSRRMDLLNALDSEGGLEKAKGILVSGNSNAVQLKNRLMELSFVSIGTGGKENKRVVKKVPANITVRNLKALANRLLAVRGKSARIYIKSKNDGTENDLDDDLRDMEFYNMGYGDEIIVEI